MTNKSPSDRFVASVMARVLMFVVFIGSGTTLYLLIQRSESSLPVCGGFAVVALIVLLIGGFFVAKARAG